MKEAPRSVLSEAGGMMSGIAEKRLAALGPKEMAIVEQLGELDGDTAQELAKTLAMVVAPAVFETHALVEYMARRAALEGHVSALIAIPGGDGVAEGCVAMISTADGMTLPEEDEVLRRIGELAKGRAMMSTPR